MVAKGGAKLISNDAIKTLKNKLLTKALLLTPNIPEAEVLAGIKIKNVNDQETSLSKVMDISLRPKDTAVIVNYDGPEIGTSSDGNIKIISYSPNLISLQAKTEGGALLVLSEIFYEPGWKCKVDGQLVPIYQTNHILRSVYIPDGSHKVEFYYDNSDWKMAKVVSRFTFFSSILFLGLILYRENKNKIS